MKIAEKKISKQDEDKSLVAILKDEKTSSRQKESAFNRLYAKHQRQVMLYFLKNTKEEEDAEDLKMLTFEKVHANIKAYNNKFAFSTWMYKIALNCLIDFKRKANFEVISIENMTSSAGEDGDVLDFQIKSDAINPEQEMIRKEKIKLVQEAIDSLDNQFIKDLMTERFINDLSFEQIAEKIGIENNSTIRVSILRGKEILKSKLYKINPFE